MGLHRGTEMMRLIDTHCHLDVAAFDSDREAVLARAHAAGVVAMVVPAITAAGWAGVTTLCSSRPMLYPALGLHPLYPAQPGDLERLERIVQTERPVALGEIGLDFFDADADRPGQQTLFEAQLALARAADLPVLLHVRKAHDTVLATLRRLRFTAGGIVHAFNGSRQQAQHYIELGFCLGFGGVVTRPRARKIRALAATLPLASLVLESDAPDMPPATHQGERNSPEYLPEILAAVAELRRESGEAIAAATSDNARLLFGMAAEGER